MRLLFFILGLSFFSCQSENLTKEQVTLKNSAVAIKNLKQLDDKLYHQISGYNIIMVGEMHGTNEPSEFVYGLCKLICTKEEKVIMAIEIAPSQMDNFSEQMTNDELKTLKFFAGENSSGMNGQAWLNLITLCNQDDNIIVEFFDHQKVSPRDSSMYVAMIDIRKNHPKTKIVTLSGNLHNRFESYKGKKMLGEYMKSDTINFEKNKIMSVMHYYSHGTMMNNMGNGLELSKIEPKENIFNRTLSSNMLFCKNIFVGKNYFTHILYTDKVSHSETISVD